MIDANATPVAYHKYLTDGSGARLPIFRLLDEPCPNCGTSHPDAKLGVIHETRDERAETVQCTLCDYSVTRPRRDPLTRRMNQR